MRNSTILSTSTQAKVERRRRVSDRHSRLLRGGKTTKEAILIIADEESKSPKTIYSILEGWR